MLTLKQHIKSNSFRQWLDFSSIKHPVNVWCLTKQKVVKIIDEDWSFRFAIIDKKDVN